MLQPTPFCNIACRYCYLSSRHVSVRMSPDICRHVAASLVPVEQRVDLVWHCGEPLACGIDHLEQLFEPFEALRAGHAIQHSIQTNATLIDASWCEFFRKFDVSVSVSVDGPPEMNGERIDRRGVNTIDKCLEGVGLLKDNAIPFNTISVVTEQSIRRAPEIYEFLVELGPTSAAFNVLELDGASSVRQLDDLDVRDFWIGLYRAWRKNPVFLIREFRQALGFLKFATSDVYRENDGRDWLASVAVNGDIRVLSPEFIDTPSLVYNDFVVGNVLDGSLEQILSRARYAEYVSDFLVGVTKCAQTCDYFSFCRGGSASNKLSENGQLDSTETRYCRQSKMLLMDTVLDELTGVPLG